MEGMSARGEAGRMRAGIREAKLIRRRRQRYTQTAVTRMKWHYCYLNAASECFSSDFGIGNGVGPRQSGWRRHSHSRSIVARQLPQGSCHLAVVGCRLPNCQVESRFPHVRTGNGKGNYTKDVLK